MGARLEIVPLPRLSSKPDWEAWWSEAVTERDRQAVLQFLETSLSDFGMLRARTWGDGVSVELFQEGKTVFSSKSAAHSVQLEEPI